MIQVRATLSRLLEPALGAFLAACFVLPTEAAYSLVFCIVVLPCAAARVANLFRVQDAALWTGAALIAWSALTLCWGVDDGGRAGRFAVASAATLVFWLAAYEGLASEPVRERLQQALIVLGAANAALAIVHFALWPPAVDPGDTPRLQGWGITRHPVLGGAVYGAVMLTALAYAIQRPHRRAATLSAAFVAGSALVLTKSRGPEFAAAVAAVALCAAGPWRRLLLPAVAGVAALWLVLPAGVVRGGDSGHFAVWRATLDAIAARPVFGHGLAADLPASLGPARRFPHDLYLSLLFYSGVVGLGLFSVWLWLLARRLWTNRTAAQAPWCMALCLNALLAGLTDFGQITKGPGPLWLIVWLPAVLAARVQNGNPVRDTKH